MVTTRATKLTKGQRRWLIAAGLFVGMVLGGVYWWQQNNVLPVIAIPTPVMPKPNAFDLLNLAVAQMNKTVEMNRPAGFQLHGAAIPQDGRTSTTLDLEQLFQYLDDKATGKSISSLPFEPTPAEMQALIRANAQGFATLHQALHYAYQEPPARTFDHLFPHLAHFRGLGRDYWTVARVKSAGGDWGGAMDAQLDALQLGEKIPHGGAFINMLVGVAIQAIGREDAWKIVPHLTATQARVAARRVEAITATQVALAEVLQEEKWTTEASLLELFHKTHWQQELCKYTDSGSEKAMALRLSLANKRAVFAHYAAYMDKLIANAKLPYAAPKQSPEIPKDPFYQMLAPCFDKALSIATVCNTHNLLLEVALALQAYQLDHGSYPATLTALVPGYLKTIPDDPFALKGPLRYRLNGQQFVLYSIGPDGKDDGGVPSKDGVKLAVPAQKRPNRSQVTITAESTGDIVAGVNIH